MGSKRKARDSTYEPSGTRAKISKRSSHCSSKPGGARNTQARSRRVPRNAPSPSTRATSNQDQESGLSTKDADHLRDKREWTVNNILEERGRKCRVDWAYTDVPEHLLEMDRNGKAYLTSDGTKHYPPQLIETVNAQGRRVWRMRWDDEWIDKSLLNPVQQLPSSPISHSRGDSSDSYSTTLSASSTTLPSSPPEAALPSREFDEGYIGSSDMDNRRQTAKRKALNGRLGARTSSALEIVWPEQTPVPFLRFKPEKPKKEYRLRAAIKSAHKSQQITTRAGAPSRSVDKWLDDVKYPRRRPVEFKPRFVRRGQHFNIVDQSRATAALVHEVGFLVVKECSNCADGKGTFKGCVVHKDFHGGNVCTNCACSDRCKSCSFHKQSTSVKGRFNPRPWEALDPPLEGPCVTGPTPSPVPTEAPDTKFKLRSRRRKKRLIADQAAQLEANSKHSQRTSRSAKKAKLVQKTANKASKVNSATKTAARAANMVSAQVARQSGGTVNAAACSSRQEREKLPALPKQTADRSTSNSNIPGPPAARATHQSEQVVASSSRIPRDAVEVEDNAWRLLDYDHTFLQGPKTPVLAGTRFEFGRMTNAQFNFIYFCCSRENRLALYRHWRTTWKDAGGSGWPEVKWMPEHFRTDGRRALNLAVIDVACPRSICPRRAAGRGAFSQPEIIDLTADD